MTTRNLWKVPVFCFAAGLVCYELTVRIGGFLFTDISSDNVISIDQTRNLLFHGALFLLTLLLGSRLFRTMTRKELLVSVCITVAIQLLLQPFLLEWVGDLSQGVLLWLGRLDHWSGIISNLALKLWFNIPAASFLQCLAPFCFLLFPLKRS